MAQKRNRCRVKSCSVVIPTQYHFCYMHRMWSHSDVVEERKNADNPKQRLKRFFCDPCGTVHRAYMQRDCSLCGGKTEELD